MKECVTAPIPELTNDNYFEDEHYFSVSRFKRFRDCEKKGLQPFGEPTMSMMIGSYVDAFIEGTLDKFKEEHPELISSRGKTKGELKSEFQLADRICEHISNDKVFMQFMSGEKQTIMTGDIMGVPFKIKMDSYSPGIAINDLKVMATVTRKDGKYIDFITPWGYDIQLACYQEIVRQNTGEKLPCFICAVTKENPINSVIVQIPQQILDIALYQVESTIQRYYDIWLGSTEPEGCGVCEVCVESRKETPIISLTEIQNQDIM